MDSHDVLLAQLRSRVSRAEMVLFLGAGFSVEAANPSHMNVPTSAQLRDELWKIAFPDSPFEDGTTLGDALQAAKARARKTVEAMLRDRLTVAADTLPPFYGTWFSIPWQRCYTLNIDDIDQAVARRFPLPRSLSAISATSLAASDSDSPSTALEVVHLNGQLGDDLDLLTFSDIDYGKRLGAPDKWYISCAQDVVARPVLFVGTELNEPPLWQYLEMRKARGRRGAREYRPNSFLVCPQVGQARRETLRELHIDWIPMTASQFADEILSQLGDSVEQGHELLQMRFNAELSRGRPHLVSDLAARAARPTEYFLGEEPTWADLIAGRAIERECEPHLQELATRILAAETPSAPLVITGTAGSGKSTCIMRLALRLSADGTPVYWIDEQSNVDPASLRFIALQTEDPVAFLVDDADLFGKALSGWARELPHLRPSILFAAALRSSKVPDLLDSPALAGAETYERAMPVLSDRDIAALIKVLDDNNRLGILKGMSDEERIEAFRKQAGRQLLVAMIQATSGQNFREKVWDEFKELPPAQQFLYALVCLVSSQRFSLDRDELLFAMGDPDNATLNALEQLAARHIIVRQDAFLNYRARHRVIADEILDFIKSTDYIQPVLEGLCFSFANKVKPDMLRTARPWRRLIRFINHDFILKIASFEAGVAVYERLEPLLHWDAHYWLQRGSLEVERGSLDRATNWLNQAKSLAPDHLMVRTEYAYLMMKKATTNPLAPQATELFEEGRTELEAQIEHLAKETPYPFHVLGTQALVWARRAPLDPSQKRSLLEHSLAHVAAGVKLHPTNQGLQQLERDLKEEYLRTAVS